MTQRLLLKSLVVMLIMHLIIPAYAQPQGPPPPMMPPPPQGPKKIVAVSNFENKSDYSGQFNLGYGMADMLTDALMQSGQFVVVERQAVEAVMAEQNLAASGRATTTGGAQTGGIQRAQIIIEGAVTEFTESRAGGDQGFSVAGFRLGSERAEAHVAIIIRLIDTTTSQVLASQRVEGTASRGGLAYGYTGAGFSFGQSGFSQTPLGKATQIAIDRAVAFVAQQMSYVPWSGAVVKVAGGLAYINAGAEGGIMPGMMFMAFRRGEEIIDPTRGMSLGAEEFYLGRLQVVEVHPKFCKAQILDQPVESGDTVKFGNFAPQGV